MTGPVLAFDVKGTKGGRITRISDQQAADVAPATAPHGDVTVDLTAPAAPIVAATPRDDATARLRAGVLATYAGILGVDLKPTDILDRQIDADSAGLPVETLVAALNDAGLRATARTALPPKPADWPAVARLTSDNLVLVLAQTRDTVILRDPDAADHRKEVPLSDFIEHCTGRIIRADVPAAELNRRHAIQAKPGH